MSHLSTDRLAALGDDEPTPAEAAHLSSCAECARERAAYRTLVAMAHAERDSIGLPLTRWDAIASALATESPAEAQPRLVLAPSTSREGIRRFNRMPLQAAAAVLLVAGGVFAGRMSTTVPSFQASNQRGASERGGLVGNASLPADSVFFSSVDEARDAQLRSEAIYQQAAAFLAQHDSSGATDADPAVVQSRLAAYDQVISTMREAMHQAPHDPVINGYYLTTLGQREATLRQLNTVMPASLRANSF
ncbi:MAG TPA: hypothetical protein VGP25_13410 [Gemmatimonadaceae bacterium]|nr:hypothetical protein [Gemmatimonadaceae bacterium]